MTRFLRVDTIAWTVLGTPISWIELAGTVLYLLSVALVARRNIWTWPVGLVAVVLYAMLFWQVRLYSDAVEQLYYLGASLYGWWHWARTRAAPSAAVPVAYSGRRSLLATLAGTAAGGLIWGAAMTRVHRWLPAFFPAPADFPWIDAVTTVASLVAMGLVARRRVESWFYWIAVDVTGIWLYAAKGVHFVASLYGVLLILAVAGAVDWHRERQPAIG